MRSIDISNPSGVSHFGPGWNRIEGCGPGQGPPSNQNLLVLAGKVPGPDIYPRFFGCDEPGSWFHSSVPATFAPVTYVSSDHIVT